MAGEEARSRHRNRGSGLRPPEENRSDLDPEIVLRFTLARFSPSFTLIASRPFPWITLVQSLEQLSNYASGSPTLTTNQAQAINSAVQMGGGMFSTSSLLVSVLWGGIGAGFLVYAKKQRSIPAFLGGVGLTAVTFLVNSWIWMSVASIAIIIGVYYLAKQSD